MDSNPDLFRFQNCVSAGNWTRDFMVSSETRWPDSQFHRPMSSLTLIIFVYNWIMRHFNYPYDNLQYGCDINNIIIIFNLR